MRHGCSIRLSQFQYSFNPRICKRCDQLEFHVLDFPHVSIHASVKDATKNIVRTEDGVGVSIHASVKDATLEPCGRKGSGIVSIHASVKDATQYTDFLHLYKQVSIHASVKDATFDIVVCILCQRFQSTHL